MDDPARRRRRVAEDADVRHDVVPGPFSSRAAASKSTGEIRDAIWAIASSGIGSPSRFSSSASQSQSRRQVSNLNRGEKIADISAEA